ncbi:hypothetical protein AB0D60_36510 [Streptomyces sp. NPDC048306]|uniref:hypothetical protein n=1 Tax=Streptomyces sp. NPDC048306 TaxID=3154502 RepID=UPI0033F982B9
MSEHVTPEAAERLVQAVSSWYAEEIMKERRAGTPDADRMAELKRQLALCGADQQALQDAGPEETAEIAARYAALARELEGK